MGAGSDDVRLHEALHCGPSGGEGGHEVIAGVRGRVVVRQSAHGDDVGHVAWHADGHGIWAGVAGRGHYHDARLPGSHHRLVQGILPVVGLGRGAEGEVENPSVVDIPGQHHPVQGFDHVHVGGGAGGVEGLDGEQVGARGDAVVLAIHSAAAQGDAGHVGTVSALVQVGAAGGALVCDVADSQSLLGLQHVQDGIVAGHHPVLSLPVQGQGRVGPVAGVDDRHGDPPAVDALLVQRGGVHHAGIGGALGLHVADGHIVQLEVLLGIPIAIQYPEANLRLCRGEGRDIEAQRVLVVPRVLLDDVQQGIAGAPVRGDLHGNAILVGVRTLQDEVEGEGGGHHAKGEIHSPSHAGLVEEAGPALHPQLPLLHLHVAVFRAFPGLIHLHPGAGPNQAAVVVVERDLGEGIQGLAGVLSGRWAQTLQAHLSVGGDAKRGVKLTQPGLLSRGQLRPHRLDDAQLRGDGPTHLTHQRGHPGHVLALDDQRGGGGLHATGNHRLALVPRPR